MTDMLIKSLVRVSEDGMFRFTERGGREFADRISRAIFEQGGPKIETIQRALDSTDYHCYHYHFEHFQNNPIVTLTAEKSQGQRIRALYTLRYHQDFGWNWQSSFLEANKAVWGDSPEERAFATPGVALVEGTFFAQRHLGLIPAELTWETEWDTRK